MVAGPFLVVAYNAELFGGIVHTDAGFAAAWGAFPLLTAYVAQTGTLSAGSVLAAGAAFCLSAAQRSLSTPARLLRRRTSVVTGGITLADGDVITLDSARLLQPLERALRSMSWSIVLLAAALAIARLG
jgi:cytochrome bd-type quinol oxidase subunit 2